MLSVLSDPVSSAAARSSVVGALGATVSTDMLNCVAAVLLLPAASVKVPAATLTVAPVVLLVVGVKSAV